MRRRYWGDARNHQFHAVTKFVHFLCRTTTSVSTKYHPPKKISQLDLLPFVNIIFLLHLYQALKLDQVSANRPNELALSLSFQHILITFSKLLLESWHQLENGCLPFFVLFCFFRKWQFLSLIYSPLQWNRLFKHTWACFRPFPIIYVPESTRLTAGFQLRILIAFTIMRIQRYFLS